MTQETTMPAIYASLHQLMHDVKNVGKNGQMNGGGLRYKFRSIDDLTAAVGEAARANKIMLQSKILENNYTTEVAGGKTWASCRLTIQYRFTSLVDGSTVEFESAGEGRDNADKATSKAMSMALKYALGQSLLIGTNDEDPDSERPEILHNTKPETAERATQATNAIKSAQNLQQLRSIYEYAKKEHLTTIKVGGRTVEEYLTSRKTELEKVGA